MSVCVEQYVLRKNSMCQVKGRKVKIDMLLHVDAEKLASLKSLWQAEGVIEEVTFKNLSK